jgi:hypothetical protein
LWAGRQNIGDLSPISAFVKMGVITQPHPLEEAVPRVVDGTFSSLAAWTWMTKAALRSREPGGPGPREVPLLPLTSSPATDGTPDLPPLLPRPFFQC